MVDHDARRLELLEGAFQRFASQGYGTVSMRGLAQELGVSTGTLYHYFPSKEALFRALVTQRLAADIAEATGEYGPDDPPDEKLSGLVAFIARSPERLRETLRITLDYAQQHPGDPLLSRVLDGYRQPLAEALGERGGDLGLSLILGLLVQQMLTGEAQLGPHLDALVKLGP